MRIRRAKIICTIGPACDSPEQLEELITAGMDVARLNFSHGTHEEHATRYNRIRAAAEKCRKPVAILQDLCGPKIRAGKFPSGTFDVATGSEVCLVEGSGPNEDGSIPIEYEGLAEDVKIGDPILVDDGRLTFKVIGIHQGKVLAIAEQGGQLRNRVGISLPSRRVRLAALTEKDKADLSFGLSLGVDYVALSFVRNAEDVKLLREICDAWGLSVPIIAKIETPPAVDDIDNITQVADGVMVARGDLGVELPPEHVPVIQKKIIASARAAKCPVIVATEMLQSMVKSTRPTRAEASDVANAVYDGADCVMLSGETATGDHPVLSVQMMARIVQQAENSEHYAPQTSEPKRGSVPQSIARNAVDIGHELGAKVIVCFTETGGNARLLSKARPMMPIIAFSPSERTRRQMALYWGVVPNKIEPTKDADEMVDRATGHLLANGHGSPGDRFVAVFGSPLGVKGSTNTIRVRVVG